MFQSGRGRKILVNMATAGIGAMAIVIGSAICVAYAVIGPPLFFWHKWQQWREQDRRWCEWAFDDPYY